MPSSTGTRGRVRRGSHGRSPMSALLCLAAYACGVPEQPRSLARRPVGRGARLQGWRRSSSRSSSCSSAMRYSPGSWCSAARVVLVPWYALCCVLARDGRVRATERDRVVVVAESDEFEGARRGTGSTSPNARRSSVGSHAGRAAESVSVPAASTAPRRRPRSPGHCRGAQPRCAGQVPMSCAGVELHQSGVRVRTLATLLRSSGWASNRLVSSSGCRSCSTSVSCTPLALRARQAPARHRARQLLGLVVLALVDAVRCDR